MLLTIDDLSNYLKISKETIYKMAQKGNLPAIKIGNQWRFKKDRIDDWLNQKSNMNNK
jgi:excisionase family DNA binding protein